jgi:hypothetical protein
MIPLSVIFLVYFLASFTTINAHFSNNQFIIQCQLEGKVILDEFTLKKSPYLKAILLMDSTITTITIPGHGCHQNTLDLVIFDSFID